MLSHLFSCQLNHSCQLYNRDFYWNKLLFKGFHLFSYVQNRTREKRWLEASHTDKIKYVVVSEKTRLKILQANWLQFRETRRFTWTQIHKCERRTPSESELRAGPGCCLWFLESEAERDLSAVNKLISGQCRSTGSCGLEEAGVSVFLNESDAREAAVTTGSKTCTELQLGAARRPFSLLTRQTPSQTAAQHLVHKLFLSRF